VTAAAFLSPPARPPHDPLAVQQGGPAGWLEPVAASDVAIDPADCALVMAPLAGTQRSVSEPSGSLGGLVLPTWLARDCEGGLWLLGQSSGELKRFDACTCAFVTVPCTAGSGRGARAIGAPGGIAVAEDTLFLCDAGGTGRLLLFDRHSFALRAVWSPPTGSTPTPWQPVAVAVDRGTVFVADPANGGIHRFARWGGWLGFQGGLGSVTALAVDRHHRLYAIDPGAGQVFPIDPLGKPLTGVAEPHEIAHRFDCPPFPVARDGTIDLSALCEGAEERGFGRDGTPVAVPPPPDPMFATSGSWIAGPFDSRIAQCVWHSLRFEAALGEHHDVRFSAYCAEVELPSADVALISPGSWHDVPRCGTGEDALILAPPGRYLWLRIDMTSDGSTTPRLCGLTLEYPRISLRRYLPAAFGANPQAADLTDRLLAIFDSGFRAFEARIDDGAMLFDADSAPAETGRDVLGWIATWLGLALERGWPEQRRRQLVRSAGKLMACRGTVQGLRGALLLWLGWDRPAVSPRRPSCGPRCRRAARSPVMPHLVLEHWKLRRWLWLGKGRLGSDAVIWGESILGRSRLGETARNGATKLDTTRNPLLDPFNVSANRFSVFVPARHMATSQQRGQLRRLIDEQRPADAMPQVVAVHPRMRIGVQACIGFDSVVGCWPQGVTLDQARLGRGTVLSGRSPGRPPQQIGHTSRLQPAHHAAVAREREKRA
jgi:phage tail-like protein